MDSKTTQLALLVASVVLGLGWAVLAVTGHAVPDAYLALPVGALLGFLTLVSPGGNATESALLALLERLAAGQMVTGAQAVAPLVATLPPEWEALPALLHDLQNAAGVLKAQALAWHTPAPHQHTGAEVLAALAGVTGAAAAVLTPPVRPDDPPAAATPAPLPPTIPPSITGGTSSVAAAPMPGTVVTLQVDGRELGAASAPDAETLAQVAAPTPASAV